MKFIESTLKFFGFTDDDEDINDSSTVIHHVSESKPTIHNLHTHKKEKFEIRIAFPRNYEDSVNIATHLQKNRSVLVNLIYLDPSTTKRLIDFLCGTAYAMSGNMKKVTDQMLFSHPKTH